MANDDESGALVWIKEILQDQGIVDRTLRKWIAHGFFPPPDGNRLGHNFWLRSTYVKWRKDLLCGALRRESQIARRHRERAEVTAA